MLTERNDSGSSTISLNERLDYGLFFAADYRVFLAEGCQASLTSRCIFFPWRTDMFSKSWKIKANTKEKCSSRTFDTCLHEACLPRLLTFSYWQVAALLWENKSIFSAYFYDVQFWVLRVFCAFFEVEYKMLWRNIIFTSPWSHLSEVLFVKP